MRLQVLAVARVAVVVASGLTSATALANVVIDLPAPPVSAKPAQTASQNTFEEASSSAQQETQPDDQSGARPNDVGTVAIVRYGRRSAPRNTYAPYNNRYYGYGSNYGYSYPYGRYGYGCYPFGGRFRFSSSIHHGHSHGVGPIRPITVSPVILR